MALDSALVIACYSYPLALYIVLSTSLLISRSIGLEDNQVVKASHRGSAIYILQLVLSVLFFAGLGIAVSDFITSLQHGRPTAISEAFVVCNTTVLLYFSVGLLPDPDAKFRPSSSNTHAWMTAAIFELIFLIATWKRTLSGTSIVKWLSGATRLLCLTCMCAIFHWPQRQTKASVGESTGLLNSSQDYGYDSINANTPQIEAKNHKPKGNGGWVDFTLGFHLLFPHIWPSRNRRQQIRVLLCLVLMIRQRIVNILVPYQLEILISSLESGRFFIEHILLYILFRGLQGQQGVLGSIRALIWIPVSQGLFLRLTCAAFEHIMTLSLEFHLSKRIGEIMSALSKGSALNTFLDSFAFQLFPMVFDLGVAAVYFMIRFDAFYSLILIGVMWSYIYMTMYMAQWRAKARRQMALKDREMDAAKTDTMMSYETVHYNDAVQVEADRFATHVQNYQSAEYSVQSSLNALNITQNAILTVGILLVVLLSSLQISIGMRSVATFVSILSYFTQLQAPLQFFGSFYNQVQNSLIDAERMLDLFNEKPTVMDAENAKEIDQFQGRIEFDSVDFTYDDRKLALRKVSFVVTPGTSTAIVGESGSGKSTCLKLLFRFYDISSGRIRIDGHDIRDLKLQEYRKYIAAVAQDTILFNTSILYNLQYAKPDASLNEIYAACQEASIHDRILEFPEGYETKVGERGLKLSGGERQRIAIARATLKKPRIMLLDEATASLDSRTEKQIQDALEVATRGLTTITIAHRLSTITQADQILVMNKGRIVEQGTHNQLLLLDGRYHDMWKKQTRPQNQSSE